MTSERNLEDKTIEDNNKILINYVMTRKRWNLTNVVVDNIFAYNIALDMTFENEDPQPQSIEECRQRKYWFLWKEAMRHN